MWQFHWSAKSIWYCQLQNCSCKNWELYGIYGKADNWLQYFLTNHEQYVPITIATLLT